MRTPEEILKEYANFTDPNQRDTIEILPLSIIDAMIEFVDDYRKSVLQLLVDLEYLKGTTLLETKTPTHGAWCTCQNCGYAYEDCICNHNELLTAINGLFDNLSIPTRPSQRSEVYDAIDGERYYQDIILQSLPNRTDKSAKTVGDYIVMLQHYQQKAVEAWTMNVGTENTLDIMRKIAGIAVHCMEDHGVIHRES